MFLLLVFALTAGGCGSGSSDTPEIHTGTRTDTETGTDTATETSTDTDTAITPGSYHIYDERQPPCCRVGYYQYSIEVNQEPESNVATVMIDNQTLNCTASNAAKTLYCEGDFLSDNGFLYEYYQYDIVQQENGSIDGETRYRLSNTSSDYNCESESIITSYPPEFGSIYIVNYLEDLTLRFVSIAPCGSSGYGENELTVAIVYDTYEYFDDLNPDCYDVVACEDENHTSESRCYGDNWKNIEVERGKTWYLSLKPLESGLHLYKSEDPPFNDEIFSANE